MAASTKLFSPSIFTTIASSISSLWKRTMPKGDHDPPPTPNTGEIPLQPLVLRSFGTDAPPAPIPPTSPGASSQLGLMKRQSPQLISTSSPTDLPSASTPTMNIDSSSKHIRKMVAAVAIFLMTSASFLIVNSPDISLMRDSLAKSMASISVVLLFVTFCFGACLVLHCLVCMQPPDHLKDISVQKSLMLMGVVFMALSLLFRTLVTTASSAPLVLVSWFLALLIVILAFAFLRMVSYHKFSAGMAAPDLAAGGMDSLPV